MSEKPTYETLEKRIQELEKAYSESKQSEAALRETEEIFKCFLENSPIYVFFKDRDMRSIKLSRNYEQMLGKPLNELLGKTMDEIFPSDLAKKMIADDLKILNEGKLVVVDEEFSGTYYTTTKFPIFIDGKPRYLAGYTIDITDHKTAEDALRESEAQLRDRNSFIQAILDNLPIGLSVNYLESDSSSYMNKQYTEIHGWPKKELNTIQKLFENVFPDPAYREEILKKMLADIDSHDPDRMQWDNIEIITRDGKKKVVNIKNIPLFEQNMMIGTVQDITEHKRAEEEREKLQGQLAQAQKMESVGRLAGGVAHDFNNMLSVIIGNAEFAMDRVALEDPLHKTLKNILDAATRSAEVTRQLLAFARKQTIAPKVLDLNETVENMLSMLRRLIGEDIDLIWLPGADIRHVKIDPSQINQILANLCVNARDAIADVGRITIETNAATFDETYCADHAGFIPGNYTLLAVSDDGCGMDRQTMDKLFEPFFTTKGIGKGTGLGMSMVYGIVKQNNGFINVYSEPGQGTTFKIYLPPYKTETDCIVKEKATGSDDCGNETILLVEDEPSILEITGAMLEQFGYAVLSANSPDKAIEMAREHSGEIHLLMTDVVMPEMNGRDLAQNLLSLYPDIKRLFMSGYTANVIAHHGVLDEGVNFIQKPFMAKDLALKLREILDDSTT